MKIRPYQSGDEEGIMSLDASVLPSEWNPRTLENWFWKFTDSNPAGHALIWVAEHHGEIVGHFAAVPYRLKVFDDQVTASHTIGALVDERFQNRGLLKFVGDKLMDELYRRQIPYTWGFPNRRAYEFEKGVLGYRDLMNFDVWEWTGAKGATKDPRETPIPVEGFDSSFDRLWRECKNDYDIAVVRGSEYLNWRYLSRPDCRYFPFAWYVDKQLKGYVVMKLFQEGEILRGHLVDIFAAREDMDTLRILLRWGMFFLRREKADEATVWFQGNPSVEKILSEQGFVRKSADIPLILKINNPEKNSDRVLIKSHWYFTMGDSTEIF